MQLSNLAMFSCVWRSKNCYFEANVLGADVKKYASRPGGKHFFIKNEKIMHVVQKLDHETISWGMWWVCCIIFGPFGEDKGGILN